MNRLDFAGRRVVIVGLARQGIALARFFCAQSAHVVVSDIRPSSALQEQVAALEGLSIQYVLGGHPLTLLEGCDLLCLSGGVPPETPLPQEARARGIPLSNDSLLTLHLASAPMIGVTGSSGKTTTTSLVGEMLKASGVRTWIGGNIGTPLIDHIQEIAADDQMVLELSSFQLQLFAGNDRPSIVRKGRAVGHPVECPPGSPHIAAILNIAPNHLDRHPSMAHYTAAKANILRFQAASDVAVLGVDNRVTGRWLQEGEVDIRAGAGQPAMRFAIQARRLGFGLECAEKRSRRGQPEGAFLVRDRLLLRHGERESEICTASEIQLLGRHNLANVLAACAISGAVEASVEAMRQVAVTFTGVPHRLELVCERNGVRWYNDSIATTPERVVAALRSFDAPVVLLAGGRDKHLPWAEMADLALEKVRHFVLFGEAIERISSEVEAARRRRSSTSPAQMHHCQGLENAVEVAAQLAQEGDVVMLSPGGTSFDAYQDFEERGEHFRMLVNAL